MNLNIRLTGLCLILLSGCLLLFQIYELLRFNTWTSVSLITALGWFNVTWAFIPYDWIGVHNILKHISLGLTRTLPRCSAVYGPYTIEMVRVWRLVMSP